jgi:hypothetical protein
MCTFVHLIDGHRAATRTWLPCLLEIARTFKLLHFRMVWKSPPWVEFIDCVYECIHNPAAFKAPCDRLSTEGN